MKQTLFITIITLFFPFVILAQDADVKADKVAIQNVIQTAYVDGISNHGDIADIEDGFHPGFNLLGIQNNTLSKFPIYNWIYWVEKDKEKESESDEPKELVTVEYEMIDVTGTAAVAKLKYFKGDQHVYTDYLSLYKFEEGWKIVSKIYFKHE